LPLLPPLNGPPLGEKRTKKTGFKGESLLLVSGRLRGSARLNDNVLTHWYVEIKRDMKARSKGPHAPFRLGVG